MTLCNTCGRVPRFLSLSVNRHEPKYQNLHFSMTKCLNQVVEWSGATWQINYPVKLTIHLGNAAAKTGNRNLKAGGGSKRHAKTSKHFFSHNNHFVNTFLLTSTFSTPTSPKEPTNQSHGLGLASNLSIKGLRRLLGNVSRWKRKRDCTRWVKHTHTQVKSFNYACL